MPDIGRVTHSVRLEPRVEATLQKLFDSTPAVVLRASDRYVVISDLHLGDGGPRDDFLPNGELLVEILRRHYLAGGYTLVLNGDIEELQRFRASTIRRRWDGLYRLFDEFAAVQSLHRIVGNHDAAVGRDPLSLAVSPRSALRLSFGGDTLFIFHGHQASVFFERFNDFSGFFIRHFANRLRIPNVPAHYESRKRYLTEHRVYAFSRRRGILSVIGHTHRPLFESLSKVDMLRSRIEELSRDYPAASAGMRRGMEEEMRDCRREIDLLWEDDHRSRQGLYNGHLPAPCLFNAGSAIGKRGLTTLEIADGRIALVHWFEVPRSGQAPSRQKRRSSRKPLVLPPAGEAPRRLGESNYYRSLLREDRLDYVFSRIRLLA